MVEANFNEPSYLEKGHDRRAPITLGKFAVGARRIHARSSLSDIIGPDETRMLVDSEVTKLNTIPKAPPRPGPAVRFH